MNSTRKTSYATFQVRMPIPEGATLGELKNFVQNLDDYLDITDLMDHFDLIGTTKDPFDGIEKIAVLEDNDWNYLHSMHDLAWFMWDPEGEEAVQFQQHKPPSDQVYGENMNDNYFKHHEINGETGFNSFSPYHNWPLSTEYYTTSDTLYVLLKGQDKNLVPQNAVLLVR